ncbi:putative E3 ubiquitin-protein ligase RHG1A [Sesamum alatum]|uniref:RING-type E3 ubiquitin transferase n=1 Tax=Sesamum alatum TaxID=300844 RepID=A0AAE1Y1K4_9LAMI|nr:putative E3 ubiquitin-protein ligase RHG1A [Sesamum alatum]
MYSHQLRSAASSGGVRRAPGRFFPYFLPGEFSSSTAPPYFDGLLPPLQNMRALQRETDQRLDTYTYPNRAAAGTRTMHPRQILDIPTIPAHMYQHSIQVQGRNNLQAAFGNWIQEFETMILDDIGTEWGIENVETERGRQINITRDGGLLEKLILKYLKTRDCRPVNNDGEPKICVVCQDDLCQENSTIGVLDCGHEYHASCIRQWLQQKNIFPLCKAIALRVDNDEQI